MVSKDAAARPAVAFPETYSDGAVPSLKVLAALDVFKPAARGEESAPARTVFLDARRRETQKSNTHESSSARVEISTLRSEEEEDAPIPEEEVSHQTASSSWVESVRFGDVISLEGAVDDKPYYVRGDAASGQVDAALSDREFPSCLWRVVPAMEHGAGVVARRA